MRGNKNQKNIYKKMLRPGFEPGISDSKGGEVASTYARFQTPAVASSPPPSLTTTPMNWNKYKEYLYANQ